VLLIGDRPMKDFPEFMRTCENSIDQKSQSDGVAGWVYDGVDGKQMAYWVCQTDGISREHAHDFEEYFTVVQGQYDLIINGRRIEMRKGDEFYIPKKVPHSGKFIAGTRTIHCFGGPRADRA